MTKYEILTRIETKYNKAHKLADEAGSKISAQLVEWASRDKHYCVTPDELLSRVRWLNDAQTELAIARGQKMVLWSLLEGANE
jgi:hypothetical protein